MGLIEVELFGLFLTITKNCDLTKNFSSFSIPSGSKHYPLRLKKKVHRSVKEVCIVTNSNKSTLSLVFVVPTNVLHRDHINKESGVAYKMAKMQSHGDLQECTS